MMSKFKIPKKMGASKSTYGQNGAKKLYHKGAASHFPRHSLKTHSKNADRDPNYLPFPAYRGGGGDKSQKHEHAYEDLYENVELEQQFLLRLPVPAAASLKAALQSEAPNIKDRLGIEFASDLRKANVRWDGYIYPARFQNLPCVVESYKTIDNKTCYKTADLSGILTCRPTDDFSPPQSEDETGKEGATPEEIAKRKEKQEKKHYNLNHGITPPLKNVRKRRFRKVLKKKYETAPEIEKEVRRLFRMDNEAFNVSWELVPEGDAVPAAADKAKNDAGIAGDSAAAGPSSAVQIEDIFGGQVSSSESEEEWEEGRARNKSMEKLETTAETGNRVGGEEEEDEVERMDASQSSEAAVSAEELQEALRARDRVDTVRRELEDLRRRRRKQESEIEGLENPILKGRLTAELKRMQDEEAAKEAEYQELDAALGEY